MVHRLVVHRIQGARGVKTEDENLQSHSNFN
jgi:hypothetical protein